MHACKDVDLVTTVEPSDRAQRNDDTSNKKKSVSSPRRVNVDDVNITERETGDVPHLDNTTSTLTNSEASGQHLEDKKKTSSVSDGSEHVKGLYPKTTSKPRRKKKQAKHQRFMCSSLTWNGIFAKNDYLFNNKDTAPRSPLPREVFHIPWSARMTRHSPQHLAT